MEQAAAGTCSCSPRDPERGLGGKAPIAASSRILSVSPSQSSAFLASPRLWTQMGSRAASTAGWSPISVPTIVRGERGGACARAQRGDLLAAPRPEPRPAGAPPIHTLQVDTCPAAAHSSHCWEVPLTTNPNTSSCRTRLGLFLSPRAQACLERDRAALTPLGKAH